MLLNNYLLLRFNLINLKKTKSRDFPGIFFVISSALLSGRILATG